MDDSLVIICNNVSVPFGGVRHSFVGKSTEYFFKIHKSSIFTPKLNPEDGLTCSSVAIAVGKAGAEGCVGEELSKFLTYPPNHEDLIATARSLATEAGVNYENGSCFM